MKKTLKILVIAMLLITIATTVKAYTNDELVTYLTSSKTVAGKTVNLSDDEKGAIKKYLASNPLTDAEAEAVKAKVDAAIEIMDNAGTTDITKLSDEDKDTLLALANSVADIADVNLKVDTAKKTVTITDEAGKTVFAEKYTTRATLAYTGANYAMYILPVVAIIAVAMVVVIKKNK